MPSPSCCSSIDVVQQLVLLTKAETSCSRNDGARVSAASPVTEAAVGESVALHSIHWQPTKSAGATPPVMPVLTDCVHLEQHGAGLWALCDCEPTPESTHMLMSSMANRWVGAAFVDSSVAEPSLRIELSPLLRNFHYLGSQISSKSPLALESQDISTSYQLCLMQKRMVSWIMEELDSRGVAESPRVEFAAVEAAFPFLQSFNSATRTQLVQEAIDCFAGGALTLFENVVLLNINAPDVYVANLCSPEELRLASAFELSHATLATALAGRVIEDLASSIVSVVRRVVLPLAHKRAPALLLRALAATLQAVAPLLLPPRKSAQWLFFSVIRVLYPLLTCSDSTLTGNLCEQLEKGRSSVTDDEALSVAWSLISARTSSEGKGARAQNRTSAEKTLPSIVAGLGNSASTFFSALPPDVVDSEPNVGGVRAALPAPNTAAGCTTTSIVVRVTNKHLESCVVDTVPDEVAVITGDDEDQVTRLLGALFSTQSKHGNFVVSGPWSQQQYGSRSGVDADLVIEATVPQQQVFDQDMSAIEAVRSLANKRRASRKVTT